MSPRPTVVGRLRCKLGNHTRVEPRTGFPQPDWFAISTPHTYVCVRCGDTRTLYPAHWKEAR